MLTNEQIKGIMLIANACGNHDRVALCKRALGKRPEDADPEARAELERQLDAAAAKLEPKP